MKIPISFKQTPEDFVVEEIPLYPFRGDGDHLILKIRKKNLSTLEVIKRISQIFGIPEKLIGYAGLKDKNSVSTQHISIPYRKGIEERLKEIEDRLLEILDVTRHKNKLRPGHLKGNIFTIRISTPEPDEILRRLENVAKHGFPNLFDEQRFSSENLEKGLALLKGEKIKASPYEKRLFISAVSSYVFNLYVKKRIEKNLFFTVIPGDITVELSGRKVPTGPILGYRMPEPSLEARKLEDEVIKSVAVDKKAFKPFKAKGTRRPIRAFPEDVKVRKQNCQLILQFFLPKGCYATLLLKELSNPILSTTAGGKET